MGNEIFFMPANAMQLPIAAPLMQSAPPAGVFGFLMFPGCTAVAKAFRDVEFGFVSGGIGGRTFINSRGFAWGM